MAKITIRKIAEMAGVSATTVSYVLNDRPGISEQTRTKVQRIIEQEQYIPSSGALRSAGQNGNIYLVLDENISFSNLFYSTILDSISIAAEKHGYCIVIANQFGPFYTSAAGKAITSKKADGIIFLNDVDHDTAFFLKQRQIPFVVIDSHTKNAPYMRVCADYDMAAYRITKYLIDLGHRKIAFIGQAAIPDFYLASYSGCSRALAEHALTIHPQWLQSSACDFSSAYDCMENILQCSDLPTGIACASDLFALAAMQCALTHGYRIPDDISFIGIDDMPIASIFYPLLTTIHLDPHEFADKAIELLFRKKAEYNTQTGDCVFVRSDQLIVRGSACRVKMT